jgi:hypothetical protein
MRTTFVAPSLDAALDRDGFVVVKLLDADGVERLTKAYDQLGVAPGDPQRACLDTFHCFDVDYKEAVHAEVEAVLRPAVEPLFDDYKSLSYCYIQKWPGETSGFGLHQDISVLDETKFRSVEVWCALTDTDEENGQLWVVPGSHRWAPVPRGIHGFPPPYLGIQERLVRRHAVPVPVRAGDAIIFNHALLHFSFPNRSGRFRLVAATDMIPTEAQHLHYVAGQAGRVDVCEIDESFWTVNNPFTLRRPPTSLRRVGEVDPAEFPVLTDDDLDRLVAAGEAIDHPPLDVDYINPDLRWCHRCGTTEGVAGYVDTFIGNTNLLCERCEAAQARMAGVVGDLDPQLLEDLAEGGWATVDLSPVVDLDALRSVARSASFDGSARVLRSDRDAAPAEAARLDAELAASAQHYVDVALPGYRVVTSTVVRADPAGGGEGPELAASWQHVD